MMANQSVHSTLTALSRKLYVSTLRMRKLKDTRELWTDPESGRCYPPEVP